MRHPQPGSRSEPESRLVRQLDADALALFARKGLEAGPGAPQVGEGNAVKVRRVMQLTRDLTARPFEELRILDLGCGEGVYAIEAGLHGADVLALDVRTERMDEGAACAARHGLDNVTFRRQDVRAVSRDTHGDFDVVFCLGLLYHLDVPDVFSVLEAIHDVATGLVVVDTLIALGGDVEVTSRGRLYEGERWREHEDDDPPEVRRSRVLRSLDNTFAFRFTATSLVRALHDVGFSSVIECHAPLEPGKAADRITLAALCGERVSISTYPWVNELSEDEIARRLRSDE
jgi:2-polyprenyl-3-methyl-5-hydroxy-6-metoxy-1,4-benzoquinol methylase